MLQIIWYIVMLLVGVSISYFLFRKRGSTNNNLIAPIVHSEIPDKVINSNSQEMEATEKQINQDNLYKKQFDDMLIINELGQRITSSLKLDETFNHLFKTLNSLMDAAVVELGVYNLSMEEWTIYSNLQSNGNANYINQIADWVLKNNRNVFLSDSEKDYGRYVNEPLKVQNGQIAQSILSYPILIDDHVAGALTIISFRKNAFDDYHNETIQHLIGFLSVALQNAFTHEQVNLLKIRAEESERYEQQFLANMSHEIRTPMNAVLGMTNLLLDTELNEKQIKYLKAINVSSKNLLVIINDVLDLSKLEAGRMEIEKIPFRIREVVQNVIDTSRFKAEEKGLRFEISISPDLPEVVKGDPTRLNQILTNLASNAVKFTDKGNVTISVDRPVGSQFIQFRVIDTGIGIPEDKMHLLFGNFKQVDASTFRKYGGTGLGLAISKTLIELQGGKVDVKSVLGKGSEFSVKIPYDIGTEEEAQALHHEGSIDYDKLEGIRILVAEDNEYNQIVVNDTLQSMIKDIHIDIAENGLIALSLVQKNTYDLILMDAQMPEMDGLEATRRIRNLSDNKISSIPIIALTASVHKADIDKCIQAGMNTFVPKPFMREELFSAIAEYYQHANYYQSDKIKTEVKEVEHFETKTPKSNLNVTDISFLKKFTDNDQERMKKYIGLYLKLLPDNLVKINTAIDANDLELLVSISHSIRPHLNYMGMKNAATLAEELENNVHQKQNLDTVIMMAELVKEDCIKSKIELEEYLSTLN